MELTFGEKAVGVNPNDTLEVLNIRAHYAIVINEMHAIRCNPVAGPEQKRCASVAITEAETACMWAVKALTKKG